MWFIAGRIININNATDVSGDRRPHNGWRPQRHGGFSFFFCWVFIVWKSILRSPVSMTPLQPLCNLIYLLDSFYIWKSRIIVFFSNYSHWIIIIIQFAYLWVCFTLNVEFIILLYYVLYIKFVLLISWIYSKNASLQTKNCIHLIFNLKFED